MPVCFECFARVLTPAERRARDRAIRDAVALYNRRFRGWLTHYRALGLGDYRAREHASRKAHAGKDAP